MSLLPGLPDELGPAALQRAIATPALALVCTSYGIVIHKQTETGITEFPVSPQDIATVLSAKVGFSTGILSANTVYLSTEGARRTIVEYRPAQKTTLWLDGSDNPLRIPMPGLLLLRTTIANRSPRYRIFAVTERPTSPQAPLYHTPLPNVYQDGKICWGTVAAPAQDTLTGNSLAEDWAQILGSRFGNHGVHGICRSYPQDIRQLYIALEQRKARVYPKKELIKASATLARLLQEEE